MNKEVIYVGDPMCSWCYGFTQVIGELRAKYQDRAKFSLVMGGLRPDGTHVVDQVDLDRLGWIYDTEKACRAVVTLRLMQPGSEWAYFVAAQTAFYRDNHDPNDPDSFARLAEGFGIDRQSFLDNYLGDGAREATQGDFRWARSVGVDSFPTVVLRDEGGLAALTIGYRPLAQLEPLLGRWLDR